MTVIAPARTFAAKIKTMKKTIFLLLLTTVLINAGCDRDPYPLELERYDVFWLDRDNSGSRSLPDQVNFRVQINTTDPDPDDQFITEWELSYSVDGKFGGVLTGDEGIHSNGLSINADVHIDELSYPGGGPLQAGDGLEFRVWARDRFGTQVEKFYSFFIEE